jgi:ubiquinol-cytochrome c reductase cytochrome b subunit
VLHIYYLHIYGRSNPLGINFNYIKVNFHYYFRVKDTFYFLVVFLVFVLFSCIFGYNFIDAENFIPANILVTPSHIQPEWYFLFAYAILRAIPNKLGGVIALLRAVLILFVFRIKSSTIIYTNLNMNLFRRLLFWRLTNSFFLLTWLGSCVAEYPFIHISQLCRIIYFRLFGLILAIIHIVNFWVIK